MKLLFLPNWRVARLQTDDTRIQAPDKQVGGQGYWFFKYIKLIDSVDILDIGRGGWLRPIEKKLKFYIIQPVRAFVRRNDYDIVVSHGAQSGLMYELLCSFVSRKPIHVMFDIGGLNGDKDSPRQTRLLRYILRRRPWIVIHSSRQRSMYEKKYPELLERLRFFPFGADCDYFNQFLPASSEAASEAPAAWSAVSSTSFAAPEGSSEAPAASSGTSASEPYVLSFGYAKRDYATLIEAWRRLPATTKLRIVGWRPESVEGMPENVEFVGKVPMDELIRQIRASRFVVVPLPTFNYSYGQMSFLQSMALGKCVIVTETVSSFDYLRDAPGARLVKPYDVDDMACALRAFLSRPQQELDDYGRQNHRFVESRFNERSMAAALEGVMREAMK
jgi:glycosyltransferase involved in cell wall biosynthesis